MLGLRIRHSQGRGPWRAEGTPALCPLSCLLQVMPQFLKPHPSPPAVGQGPLRKAEWGILCRVIQGSGSLGPPPLESQTPLHHPDRHPARLGEASHPILSSRVYHTSAKGQGWPVGGRETGRGRRVRRLPLATRALGCLQRHALFSFRACLRKMRALDSPEPLQSQCTLTPKGPPHLLEKTYSLATGRFALRQHHLLALLGMTPIPSWATPES